MDNARLDLLFRRYLNDTCTPEEKHELLDFLSESDSPSVKALLNEVWNNPTDKLATTRADEILQSILERDRVIPIRQHARSNWLKVAASLSLVAVSALGVYTYLTRPASVQPVAEKIPAAVPHQFIRLADGSTVILNASSYLDYPETFDGKKTREVHLTGEAFFDIKPDPSKPFVVHTEKVTTTVLGTAFNIKAYPKEKDITVTVTRGKVKVSNRSDVMGILTPDQQITFHKETQQSEQYAVRSKEAIAWKEKDLFFDNVSMAEAARQLEERFHVSIAFKKEKIKDCRFTATFMQGEDLDQILDVISEFNGATYSKTSGGTIEISGTGCAAP